MTVTGPGVRIPLSPQTKLEFSKLRNNHPIYTQECKVGCFVFISPLFRVLWGSVGLNCCFLCGTEDNKKDVCSSGLLFFSPAFQAGRVVVCTLRKSLTCGYENIAFQAKSALYYFMMRLLWSTGLTLVYLLPLFI
ncbi:MAG: hypothetical protein LBP34_06530 [Flavobacteriaceae bacterium]|nr:hypothetical protein [Flavobacteriaceae bacterium]